MSDEVLGDRRRALEDEFFRKQDAKILAQLTEARERETTRESLTDASGIDDPKLLDTLIDHGVDASTFAALALVPLVEVGWADGKLDQTERTAILDAARQNGVTDDSTAMRLLQNWLDSPSAPSLLRGWVQYVQTLCTEFSKDERQRLRKDVLGRAQSVAEAAGGFLGIGTVSAEEKEVLRLLETAFDE